jgi:hypothetical protein
VIAGRPRRGAQVLRQADAALDGISVLATQGREAFAENLLDIGAASRVALMVPLDQAAALAENRDWLPLALAPGSSSFPYDAAVGRSA